MSGNTTGAICTEPGIYQSACPHGGRVILRKGDEFPYCVLCLEELVWRRIAALERHRGEAAPVGSSEIKPQPGSWLPHRQSGR